MIRGSIFNALNFNALNLPAFVARMTNFRVSGYSMDMLL
jgi:hypothetical protein